MYQAVGQIGRTTHKLRFFGPDSDVFFHKDEKRVKFFRVVGPQAKRFVRFGGLSVYCFYQLLDFLDASGQMRARRRRWKVVET